jgi:hypothetical protein
MTLGCHVYMAFTFWSPYVPMVCTRNSFNHTFTLAHLHLPFTLANTRPMNEPMHAHTNFHVDRSVNKCFTVHRLRHRNVNEVNCHVTWFCPIGNQEN